MTETACRIEEKAGKQFRLESEDGRWTMQPIGMVSAAEAQRICKVAAAMLNPPTPAMQDAMQLMLWDSANIAAILRADGRDIKTRAEDEQSAVLLWALGMAIEHGDDWRARAGEYVQQVRDRVKAAGLQEPRAGT